MRFDFEELIVDGQTNDLKIGVNKNRLDEIFGSAELGWNNDGDYVNNQF